MHCILGSEKGGGAGLPSKSATELLVRLTIMIIHTRLVCTFYDVLSRFCGKEDDLKWCVHLS